MISFVSATLVERDYFGEGHNLLKSRVTQCCATELLFPILSECSYPIPRIGESCFYRLYPLPCENNKDSGHGRTEVGDMDSKQSHAVSHCPKGCIRTIHHSVPGRTDSENALLR